MPDLEKQECPPAYRTRLGNFFQTQRFHYCIIGIVFLDLSLLLIGLVLAIYGTPATLKANYILFLISWIFPTIFFIEIGLKMWTSGGAKKYFTTYIKIWDLIILIFSVVSDVALYFLLIKHASATSTAVIVFRLWKIVRLFHAYSHIVLIQNQEEKMIILESNRKLLAEVESLRTENLGLRNSSFGFDQSSILPSPSKSKIPQSPIPIMSDTNRYLD